MEGSAAVDRAQSSTASRPRLKFATVAPTQRTPRGTRTTKRFPTLADWISLSRLPLGAAVWLHPEDAVYVIAILFVAAASDVLDGWVARRRGGGDAGVWLDPLCDKLFVVTAAAAIWHARRPPIELLPLLVSREIVQTVTLVFMSVVPRLRPRRSLDLRAARIGKAVTSLQFATVGLILLSLPGQTACAVATGGVGLAAGAYYAIRLLRRPAGGRAAES